MRAAQAPSFVPTTIFYQIPARVAGAGTQEYFSPLNECDRKAIAQSDRARDGIPSEFRHLTLELRLSLGTAAPNDKEYSPA
jgi:hypothetical protein